MNAQLQAIHVFPVKGLSHQPLETAKLTVEGGLAGDREYALAHGASDFDPAHPSWQPKRQFLTLARNPRLGKLQSRYDAASSTVTLLRDGKQVARGNLSTSVGRDVISQFFSAYMGEEALGSVRIVEAPGVRFTDVPEDYLSLVNLASVADLERVARQPVDPLRFRGNLVLSEAPPWVEFGWIGKRLHIGDAVVAVCGRITRCAATEVNPSTGENDLNVPRLLRGGFGHLDCGVYLEVVEDGEVKAGDPVRVIEDGQG